jgi:hypothetical protein
LALPPFFISLIFFFFNVVEHCTRTLTFASFNKTGQIKARSEWKRLAAVRREQLSS